MRKSKELRLSQAENLLQNYKLAGLLSTGPGRFLQDMCFKMKRGKYPTKRQRDWLDNLIQEGVPEPKGDTAYLKLIDEALETKGIDFHSILGEFRGKVARGWDLSPKQKKWCDSLIEKAKSIRDGDYWKPDEATAKRIKLAVSLECCYNRTFWSTHGGGANAMEKAKQWLNSDGETIIDEYTVEKLFKTVAGKLRLMENPKFEAGQMAYVICRKTFGNWDKHYGIVVSGPKPVLGGIAYDVLVEGKIVSSLNITKRR